jgi:hypothetical protein
MITRITETFKVICIFNHTNIQLIRFSDNWDKQKEYKRFEISNKFNQKQLHFLEFNSPIFIIEQSYFEMLDSDDIPTNELAQALCIAKIINHIEEWSGD